jgi:hypothetical protein
MEDDKDYAEFEARRAQQEEEEDRRDREHPAEAVPHAPEPPAPPGRKLAIVVGHTRIAPGASGGPPINQSEYPWNKDLAAMIAQVCTGRAIICKTFFRDGIGISGAYAQVDAFRADAVIELHFNAADGAGHGTETLFGNIQGARPFADAIQRRMLAALGLRDRGVKKRVPPERGGQSVNSSEMPAVLIEPFFGDRASDAAVGQTRKRALATALVDAFEDVKPPPSA